MAVQNTYPLPLTYCSDGWYPDPIVTSYANGASAGVTYSFYFALEGYTGSTATLNVEFPTDSYTYTSPKTMTATKLSDTDDCFYASYLVNNNPS
jgi:hypothetical protein